MKWVEFLKREMSFCTVYAHIQSYTQIIPKITGCQLSRVIYYYDGRNTHFLHEESEMARFGSFVKQKISAEPLLALTWLDNASKYQNKALKFISDAKKKLPNLKAALDFYSNYLANAVNIPHRLSWVFDNTTDISEELRKKLLGVRSQSHFLEIEKIILKIMTDLAADKTAKITLISPAEVLGDSPWPAKEEIKQREIGWMLQLIDGKRKFKSGFSVIAEYENLIAFDKNVKQVLGSVAYRGKVRGKVKVVMDHSELPHIINDTILVTNMTTPEFLPYLKKVIGIVTDEGGVTCHAAIISRELKIPCVIGTKIATKVLKDGDRVEVDALKGIVRKL